jgi:hypothetical protein
MEESCQLHAQAALALRMSPKYLTHRRLGGFSEPVWLLGEQKNFCPRQELKAVSSNPLPNHYTSNAMPARTTKILFGKVAKNAQTSLDEKMF